MNWTKRIVLFAALCCCYCATLYLATTALAQEQRLNPGRYAAIYEYKGLKRGINQLWMVFEVFTADPKKHDEVWVPPWALNVETQDLKAQEGGARLTWRLEEGCGYAAEAWLRVGSDAAKEAWEKYLRKLKEELTLRRTLYAEEITSGFLSGVGLTLVLTTKNYRVNVPVVGTVSMAKISVPVDRVSVVFDPDAPRTHAVVPWGLALLKAEIGVGCDHSYSVAAPKLEIRSADKTMVAYWEITVMQWEQKLKPHIVLPPEEKK